jgi:lactoylglutathione lyase
MISQPRHTPIARIDRLVLGTAQLERLRAFYAGQLGAQASPVYERAGGARAVLLDFCGVGIELIEHRAGHERPRARGPGAAHVVFALGSADAVDRLTTRLAAAGHRVVERPHRSGDGCYRSAVVDPDGNHVGLTV